MKIRETPNQETERHRHLLVVDDEASIREVLKSYLEIHGYQVTTAATGAEALRLARLLPMDLTVLDVVLDDMDGLDVLVKIKKARPRRPVVMITGLGADDDVKRRAIEKGAATCVSKTLPLQELLKSIEQVLAESLAKASATREADAARPSRRTQAPRPAPPAKAPRPADKNPAIPQSAHAEPSPAPPTPETIRKAGGPPQPAPGGDQAGASKSKAPAQTEEGPRPASRVGAAIAVPPVAADQAEPTPQEPASAPAASAVPADPGSVARVVSVTPDAARYEFGVEVFLRMLAGYHPNLANTAMRAVFLCKTIGDVLQLPASQLQDFLWAAALHDISLVRVERSLLNRWLRNPDKCAKEEIALIKRHPQNAQRMLEFCPAFKGAGQIIAAHHENWDGGGYPNGLKMEMIPWLARLLSVVIFYCGKHTRSEKTVAEIEAQANRLYDSQAVQALVKAVPLTQMPLGEMEVASSDLRPGMILARDIANWDGVLIVGKGSVLNITMINKIVHLAQAGEIEFRALVCA